MSHPGVINTASVQAQWEVGDCMKRCRSREEGRERGRIRSKREKKRKVMKKSKKILDIIWVE